jgi:hypothetical protein
MRSYLTSKPPSQVDTSWFTWSLEDFTNIDPESDKIEALLYITRKNKICIIYKPTPIKKPDGTLVGIIGNMFSKKCTPAFFKIDGDKIGLCYAIQKHEKIPTKNWPEISLQADIVKGTNYENYSHEISMWVIPNLSPLPFGAKIEQTSFNDAFNKEMGTISKYHGMWAKLMAEVIDQAATKESDVPTITKRLINSSGTRNRNPCCPASKGFRSATIPTSAPFVEISSLGKKFPEQQATLCSYFERNPTPACVEEPPADASQEEPRVQVISTAATDAETDGLDKEFYRVMIETMKNLQNGAPIQHQKIVVESRNHEETVDSTKLQTSMVRLMYATTNTVDWVEGTVESVCLGTFTQEFKNLLEHSTMVQVTQLTNLAKTIFTAESEDNDDNSPLNRLMSLYVFQEKFVKRHQNATFQSDDLKLAAIHKSTSINPFHYGLQNDQTLVIAARKEQEEERNEKNFSIIETHRKKISSLIKGIGKINTMEDDAMTCANMCGMQLAIINIAAGKPLLFQYVYKMICFIENKKMPAGMHAMRSSLRTCPCFLWQNFISFSKIWHFSPRTALTPISLNTAPPATSWISGTSQSR